MQYQIFSPYECLIKDEHQSLELNKNSHIFVENENMLAVYPIGKSSLAFNIDLKNLSNSPFYTFYLKDDKCVIYLIEGLKSENSQIVNFGSNFSPFIELTSDSVTFTCPTYRKTVTTGKYQNFECFHNYNISLAHLYENERHLLIAFNEKTGKAKSFKGHNIEIKKDTFKVYQKFEDLAGHDIETSYKIDNEGLKRIKIDIKYKYDKPRVISNTKTIPFAFLEAIKIGNYNLAHSYLDESINISIEKLKEFLPTFDFFFPFDSNTFIINANGEHKKLKFEIKKSKIIEIED